jgi:hypothetical protein
MLDSCSDLHFVAIFADNVKQSECSQSTAVPKFPNIDSLDCWDLETKPSGDNTNSTASLHPCDQKSKNIFPDVHVPPLKLGSLLGGGDGHDSNANGVNSRNSSSVTVVSEREETSKASLYYSGYKESSSSSCQGTNECITYLSSTYVTSDSQAFKTLNKEKVASNKMCLLSSESHSDFQGKCKLLNTRRRAAERKQNNNINPINNYFPERRMNLAAVQNDSLEGSASTSTTYRSIQLYKSVREIKRISEQDCGREPTQLDVTDDHSILNHIPVQMEGPKSSARHAVGVIESDISRRKLIGSALRYLLLAFFSAEQCLDNSCICHRSSSKPVTPRNHIHHTSVENENIASERGSRNVCHVGTHVNLTSTLNDIDCGAKRTLPTDGIVNGVVEAAGSESSDSFRYM